jgi:Domain of unknown function (DUF222)/HNH endonuclease
LRVANPAGARYDANMCSITEELGPTPEGPEELDSAAVLARLRDTPTEELEATFRELDSLHNATGAHRLLVLAVLDERDVGRDDGALDTIGWVMWTARVTRSRARALVETARAMPDRPEIGSVAMQGRLSGEQVEAIVRVATPDTDAQWALDGPGWTATSLHAAAKNRRAIGTDEAIARHQRRELNYRWNESRGELRLWGRIPDEAGALVAVALARAADRAGPDEHGQWEPFPVRCADAFVSALSRDLVEDGEPHRATVIVHTPEAALHDGSSEPGAYVDAADSGIPIANDTTRRLACDAVRQAVVEGADGVAIRLGRRIRTVPPHLLRLLKHRDRHCRAPGCIRTRGLQAHHVVHWADGGTTDLDNLMLVCSRHHRLLHEHRWQIRGHPGRPETVEFQQPDGRTITPYRPPPLDARVRERFLVSTS